MKKLIFILLGLAGIAACQVGPKYERSSYASDKKSFAGLDSLSKDSVNLAKWFEIYKDEALQNLIKTALEKNLDLKLTVARIEEARLNAGMVRTNYYPSINYNLGAGTSNAKQNAMESRVAFPRDYYTGAVTLDWELDIFGKIRSNREAYLNTLYEQEELKKNLNVILVAQVAENYFLLRDLDNRLAIAERTLKSRKESLRINSERFQKGYSPEIDQLQAQMQLSTIEASIPGLKRQIIVVENTLNALCGRSGGSISRGQSVSNQNLPDSIPSGLPSQLLERRPDIKAAEYRVIAQNNRARVAQASRFPTLSLTGALGMASPQLSTLVSGNSSFASVGGNLVGPIFAFGQNKRRYQAQVERTKQVQAEYEKTIMNAFLEVDNSLSNNHYLQEEYLARQTQVKAARKALELSMQRYNFGYTSYLEVLIQENSLLDAENFESITLRQRQTALVSLYKALGGGW